MRQDTNKIAAVIPSFKVGDSIINVVQRTLSVVDFVYVIDDLCPEQSGVLVAEAFSHDRVMVIFNESNLGVGGAVIVGYRQALLDNYDIIVKVDGDGQMDPKLIPSLVDPIIKRRADYVKGNRFFRLEDLEKMPKIRLFGNSVLSIVSKISSGYWNIMDPTNGFTAIHRYALKQIQLEKISERYFFESDMLFRLYLIRAVVCDFPMRAHYADEKSNLNIMRVIIEFPKMYMKNFFKRVFYVYLLRDFNAATIQGFFGLTFLIFGVLFGVINWIDFEEKGQYASNGTVMFAALPIIIGMQLLISALTIDVSLVPSEPLQLSNDSMVELDHQFEG